MAALGIAECGDSVEHLQIEGQFRAGPGFHRHYHSPLSRHPAAGLRALTCSSERRHMKQRFPSVRRAARVAAAGLLFTATAQAAVINVDTPEDVVAEDGFCSLREAIQAADTDTAVDTCAAGNGADRIVIPEGTYQLVGGGDENANVSGDLDIQTEVSLEGAGASRTILLGSGSDRVLHALPGSKVTLRDLRVTGGRTLIGGGIYNAGQLNLINVLVDGNQASHGGGIASFGPLSLTGSQLVDNTAQG